MTPRNGDTCNICGYPVPSPGEFLCEQCAEWQGIAKAAEFGIAELQRPADQGATG